MPVLIIALLVVLIMGIVFTVIYFSGLLIFKLLRMLIGAAVITTSLPHAVKKSLQEARHYAQLIKTTVQQHPPGPVRDRLNLTIKPVDEWLANLARLEQALTKLYAHQNLPRELRRANSEIEQLRRRILTASQAEVASLRALMKSKQNYREVLRELQSFQNQAELKIHKIASDLGTAHSEMLLVTTKGDFNHNRFQRLDENLQENLTGLRDILAAMDEMGYSSATG